MNSFFWIIGAVLFIVAAWFAWRYYDFKRHVVQYARLVRSSPETLPTDVKEIETLSNAIVSLKTTFNMQLSTLNQENERLSTVLEQLTDGVIIVDAHGLIQFANPAAQRLFEISDVLGHSVTEVVRNHQLVDAWRRCQQTNEMQSETVELPARHQFLQLIAIPDTHCERKSDPCTGFDTRAQTRNCAAGFHLKYFARTADTARLAQSINGDITKRRSCRPRSWSAFPEQDQRRNGRADADGSGIA